MGSGEATHTEVRGRNGEPSSVHAHLDPMKKTSKAAFLSLASLSLLLCAPRSDAHQQAKPFYAILSPNPTVFPVLPFQGNYPLRDLYQSDMLVKVSVGTPPPAYVHFKDRNTLDYEVPISGFQQVGIDTWKLTTPHSLVPNLISGPCGISVGNHLVSTESKYASGMLP